MHATTHPGRIASGDRQRAARWLVTLSLLAPAPLGATALFAADAKPAAPRADRPTGPAASPTLAPAEAPVPLHLQVYRQTLRSTAMVLSLKNGKPDVMGTGWVLDRQRRLLVTNHHVAGHVDNVLVFFPAYENGELIVDSSHYLSKVTPIAGHVFDSDARRDLAVIQLDWLPAEIEAIPLADHSARPGDQVHSIGNPGTAGGAFWVYTTGSVRQIHHMKIPYSNDQTVDARVLQTQSPANPGDSGGPVVNDRGELVAIVSGGRANAQLMTFFIDIQEIKSYIGEFTPLLEPRTADDFFRRGNNYYQKKRFARTIGDVSEAIRLEPRSARHYNLRGSARYSNKQYAAAIEDYSQAVRLRPDFALAYSNRAWGFFKKGDLDTAVSDFNDAIKLDPKLHLAHFGRGSLHADRKNYDRAIADLSNAIRFQPAKANYYNERGVVYYHQRQWDKAIADLDDAVRLEPDAPVHYANRAKAHAAKGTHEPAIQDFSMAIQRDQTKSEWFNSRGVSFYRLAAYPPAIEDFTMAIKLNPMKTTYWNNRGDAWKKLGWKDRAGQDYAQARQIADHAPAKPGPAASQAE